MASIFDVFKTFRPRRTIMSEDFNALQAALKASFDRIGTAPPAGMTGVSTPFHCADPTETQHSVTLGYFLSEANAAFAPNIEKARQWAEQTADTDVNGTPGARSALHWSGVAEYWAGEAEAVVFADAATAAQGTRADTAHGWGDHAAAGYLTSVSWGIITGKPTTLSGYGVTSVDLGSWVVTEDASGDLLFSDGATAKMKLTAAGDLLVVGDVKASATL